MIIYAVIGRAADASVLVESSTAGLEGNYPLITRELLQCIRQDPELLVEGERKTFSQRNDVETAGGLFGLASSGFGLCSTDTELDSFFHCLHGSGSDVVCVCISDDSNPRMQAVNLSFLEDAEQEFTKQYSQHKIKKANAYGMEKSFAPNFRKLIHYYNTNQKSMATNQSVSARLAEVEELKQVMGRNISMILKRGDDLDRLVEKSDSMLEETQVFHKRSNTLKKTMRKKNWCYGSLFALFIATIIYSIVAGACGFTLSRCTS